MPGRPSPGEISPQGQVRGRATLVLGGSLAATFLEEIAGLGAVARDEEVRSLLAHLLPGAALSEIAWREGEGEVPEVGIAAARVADELVRGEGTCRSLQLPGMRATPVPRLRCEDPAPASGRPERHGPEDPCYRSPSRQAAPPAQRRWYAGAFVDGSWLVRLLVRAGDQGCARVRLASRAIRSRSGRELAGSR